MATLARLLTTLLRRSPPAGEPPVDADLLTRFAKTRDAAAFELLVWRHGALVLGTCRRMLRHEQSAEDAFQAVFLILAKKAGAVRTQLAGYLHATARRVCLRMAKRTPFAALEAEPPAAVPPEASDPELAALLDAEVGRLPEKFRLAVVLCYLRGLTTEQAADHLGIPKGTVLSRLATARKRLTERLTAKGVTVPAAFLTTALATPELSADVGGRVTTAALDFVTSKLPITVPSQLATEVLNMTTQKSILAVALAVVLVAGAGTGVGWALADGDKPAEQPKPVVKAEQPKPPVPAADPRGLGPDHPEVARQRLQLERIIDQIARQEQMLERMVAESLKIGSPRPARQRLNAELSIELAKKVLETEIAVVVARAELKDAEELFKKVGGKAEERVRLSNELVALQERLAQVAGKEKEMIREVEQLQATQKPESGALVTARTRLGETAKLRAEMEGVTAARQQALSLVNVAAAEADTKRLAAEKCRSQLSQWTNKLDLLKAKLDQLEAESAKNAEVERVHQAVQTRIDATRDQLRRLLSMKADLELQMLPASAGEPNEKLDRILRLVEELRREVKELRDNKQ